MKIFSVKALACLLAVSVAWMGGLSAPAEAMLVPTHLMAPESPATAQADLHTIEKALESKALRGRLHALGLSDAEIDNRLSRLSDQQKHQLASQIRAVNPAGDGGWVVGILVIVALVLLIVYLAKRV